MVYCVNTQKKKKKISARARQLTPQGMDENQKTFFLAYSDVSNNRGGRDQVF